LTSLSDLSGPLQSLLKVASVLAKPGIVENGVTVLRVDKAMLVGLHGGSISDAVGMLYAPEMERYLVDDPAAAVPSLRFRNQVVCEVVYSLLMLSQRRHVHALTAQWLERLQLISPNPACEAAISWHWQRSYSNSVADEADMSIWLNLQQKLPPAVAATNVADNASVTRMLVEHAATSSAELEFPCRLEVTPPLIATDRH
jgi:hypothetical protein